MGWYLAQVVSAWQAQGHESKPQYHQKEKA
jgi:hypothetical protein